MVHNHDRNLFFDGRPLALAFPTAAVMWFSSMWPDTQGGYAGTSIVPQMRGLIYYTMFLGLAGSSIANRNS